MTLVIGYIVTQIIYRVSFNSQKKKPKLCNTFTNLREPMTSLPEIYLNPY